MDNEELNASEAIHAFIGWVLVQEVDIAPDFDRDTKIWANKMAQFCNEQGLKGLSDGWMRKLKRSVYE